MKKGDIFTPKVISEYDGPYISGLRQVWSTSFITTRLIRTVISITTSCESCNYCPPTPYMGILVLRPLIQEWE